MKAYPHTYRVSAHGSAVGTVPVVSQGLPAIETAPPPEFDGPGGVWSPETLLVAAIANCFILTFRGISRAVHFDWEKLEAQVDGTLERVSGSTQFTRYATRATLTVKAGIDHAKARELLERAEKVCLVANSLRGERTLEVQLLEASEVAPSPP
ncbi:MAG: OsmC family protein [Steroidobacteraceae bacterium]